MTLRALVVVLESALAMGAIALYVKGAFEFRVHR
jgi:hypothetical protein